MRRILFMLVALAVMLSAGAQETFKVNYKGARPTISDFVQAYVTNCVDDKVEVEIDEAGIAFKTLWTDYRKGTPLPEGATMTVDERGGFVSCDNGQGEFLTRWEMCYWNEADGRHKLFAYGTSTFQNGRFIAGQYDGLEFYRYDNATKTMRLCDDEALRRRYMTSDGAWISYALPRTGKDIVTTSWYDDGRQKQSVLKWNGHGFIPADAVGIIDGAESVLAYVKRYLKQMRAEAENIEFDMYAIVDIDGDGRAEILLKQGDDNFAAFAVGSGKPELLVQFDFRSTFVFYEGTVGYQGSCGTGCHMGEYAVVRNSRLGAKYNIVDYYDMDGNAMPDECVYEKDGQTITAAEASRLFKSGGPMGQDLDYTPEWHDLSD